MKHLSTFIILAVMSSWLWSCKSKSDDSTTPASKKYALVIKSGGQAVKVGNSFQFEAQLVGTDGTIIPVTTGISYSSSAGAVATFSGTTLTGVGEGTATITASYTYQGTTYTASVPLVIQPLQSVFAVNPWTIWWEADNSEFPLTPIYLGMATTSPTYTYTSSDPSIASVSAAGVVKVIKAGSCVITVTSSLQGNPSVTVPVLVFGEPTVALPVTQVKISPGTYEMFKDETMNFTAKAFKGDGSEVTGKTIKWWIKTTDSSDTGPAASIDQTGKVTAIRLGEASVYAEIEGIVAQANITINPEFAFFIEPFSATLKPDKTKEFTLKTYKVDKALYRAHDPNAITLTSNPAAVKWALPFADIPGFPSAFSIVSQNANTCTIKANSSATVGLPGFLLAYMENDDKYAEGGAALTVALPCDCGSNNPDVVSISSVSSLTLNSAAFPPESASLNASAMDAFGTPVFGADLHYCSSDNAVAAVGFDGTVQAISPGTTIITICVGNKEKEVTVTVN